MPRRDVSTVIVAAHESLDILATFGRRTLARRAGDAQILAGRQVVLVGIAEDVAELVSDSAALQAIEIEMHLSVQPDPPGGIPLRAHKRAIFPIHYKEPDVRVGQADGDVRREHQIERGGTADQHEFAVPHVIDCAHPVFNEVGVELIRFPHSALVDAAADRQTHFGGREVHRQQRPRGFGMVAIRTFRSRLLIVRLIRAKGRDQRVHLCGRQTGVCEHEKQTGLVAQRP